MNTMQFYLFGIKAPAKYSALFRELVNCREVEIVNYVSKYGNLVPRTIKCFHFSWLSWLESRYVLRKNGFANKVKTISSIDKIKSDDVIIAFVHSKGGCDDLEKLTGKVVVHLNQYHFHTIKTLNYILPLANAFVLEADVFKKENYICKCNLPLNYDFYLTPYIVTNRFSCIKSYDARINKAVATGTIGICRNEDYINLYGTNLCHKMRKVIYDNRTELESYMDTYISPYVETGKLKTAKENDRPIKKLCNSFYNTVIAKAGKQKKYFSFDIVEKYNDYKMAVVPEEVVGMPGIGAFEAMACGCAFIGIEHQMYSDLGMKPNVHYIVYDGTIDNLKSVIHFYQTHPRELSIIANNGSQFVEDNFRSKEVVKLLLNNLGVM